MTEQTHKCTKCGEVKVENDFPHAKGKRHSWCRACHKIAKAEYRKKYREENPRKVRIAEDYLVENGTKSVCVKCSVAYPLCHYQGGRGGGWCRACRAELERERRRKQGIKPKSFSVIEGGEKLCMSCKTMKPLVEFSPSERGLGGLAAYCKPCQNSRYNDREKGRKATARYREKHRERHLARHRVRMYEYRTRKLVSSDGTVTDEFLKELYGTKICHYCKKETPRKLRTADHMTPLNLDGTHSASNLVMACWTCNSSKRDIPYDEFVAKLKVA